MKRFWLFVLPTLFFFSSCRETVSGPDVPLVIFDTDIGSSADDLFALELLHCYHQQGRCKLLGVVVDREGACYAACADVMNTFFGHPDIPIGQVREGIKDPKVFIDYRDLPQWTDDQGRLLFKRSLAEDAPIPDGWQLYRRLLSDQADCSVSIVSVGFLTCLSQLLQSGPDEISPLSGAELVRRKVRCLYVMGGKFGYFVEQDYNFSSGHPFSQAFFALWPAEVPMMFSPSETGGAIEYAPETVLEDISWTDVHPIKQVYLRCDCNTGQRMWDPLPVIQAVEGGDGFTLSEWGEVTYTDSGLTQFFPSASGKSRYQIPGSADWNAQMLERIRLFTRQH